MMKVARQFHSCGYYTKNESVVVSGMSDAFPGSSLEIFTVDSMSWLEGESLLYLWAG